MFVASIPRLFLCPKIERKSRRKLFAVEFATRLQQTCNKVATTKRRNGAGLRGLLERKLATRLQQG